MPNLIAHGSRSLPMKNIQCFERADAKGTGKANMSTSSQNRVFSNAKLVLFHCTQPNQNFQTVAGMHTANAFGVEMSATYSFAKRTTKLSGSQKLAATTAVHI